ncbi:hypothetical protein LEP1GSC170_0926 [Leptospira interrogans serovar Bataviae str. HAI135]|uniref:Uncharacterized protein n=1 Tax=Leptospira noguchii serovar Autumnalis str. ZUN142 TaxID=1085540 RepID=M6UAK6_9LEPT|nr:hypothetical protein LEP1GSC170_0926 [Leptospira interrogans serovar Bataviae str. HAI135]EMO41530.1 hypothetical protein LEP1GSC186_1743 [Leptospira noguchii serovar Autumnalis str. ZUN142]
MCNRKDHLEFTGESFFIDGSQFILQFSEWNCKISICGSSHKLNHIASI